MKKLTLTFAILCAFGALAFAGTEQYSGKEKEVLQPAPPPCEWYRAHEWDLDLWGAFTFVSNDGIRDFRRTSGFENAPEDTGADPDQFIDIGQYHNDNFINRDNAWAGGADIKFFFNKYWALGVNGFVVDANDNAGGGGFGTFTLRYPIGCSRFAPYAWAGGGAVGGGSNSHWIFFETHKLNSFQEEVEFEGRKGQTFNNTRTEVAGQFGGGLEIRVTKHLGVMGDFCWNVLNRPDNDFGMARFGVTLSY
jgi:hypothetical protein